MEDIDKTIKINKDWVEMMRKGDYIKPGASNFRFQLRFIQIYRQEFIEIQKKIAEVINDLWDVKVQEEVKILRNEKILKR